MDLKQLLFKSVEIIKYGMNNVIEYVYSKVTGRTKPAQEVLKETLSAAKDLEEVVLQTVAHLFTNVLAALTAIQKFLVNEQESDVNNYYEYQVNN